MALKQVEDGYAQQNSGGLYGGQGTGSTWAISSTTAPAAVFRLRNELANLLEDWAVKCGATHDVDATQFAEKLLAEGWSK
jgi:hypothetical protein